MDNKLIPAENSNIMQLIHTNNSALSSMEPFARDILLFETHIAGTTHIPGMEELVKKLNTGDRLDFFREPDNNYDELAILVKTKDGTKIGYVPMRDNVVFSRLMDAGKLIFGKISKIKNSGGWIKITMEIYLHE